MNLLNMCMIIVIVVVFMIIKVIFLWENNMFWICWYWMFYIEGYCGILCDVKVSMIVFWLKNMIVYFSNVFSIYFLC